MSTYAVINLKTEPDLKKLAAKVAEKLGVSLSAVLNNELRRFANEQSVTFDLIESPNAETLKSVEKSASELHKGDYHKFDSNSESLEFLKRELL